MAISIDYALPGLFTTLDTVPTAALDPIAGDPVGICSPVHSLLVQPTDAQELGLPEHRFATNQIRPADALVQAILALDPAPLNVACPPDRTSAVRRQIRGLSGAFGLVRALCHGGESRNV